MFIEMKMKIDRFVSIYCYFFPLFSSIISTAAELNLSDDETRLMRILLNESTYLKKVRPTNKVFVDIRFNFNQIISMVEKEQVIVTNCFVDQKWTDPRLTWNPLDFRNITWIRMPATFIWYPDTFLYNTADNAGFLLPQDSQNMMLSFNGTVFWPLPLAQLRTRCRMTIKHFPFDEQTCEMILGSWSHTGSLIHYRFWDEKPELTQYTPNNEWKLLAVTQSIKRVGFPNWVEPDEFFEVNFTILIVRKPLQAIYNTVVPALMLTTLTLVSFFIPFAQEMQIGISILLAYSVFSLRLSEDVPSQSDSVHLISLYLTVCMLFSLSAMTWFAIANKLREKKRLPYWLRWLALDYISWIVFAASMHRKARRAAKQERTKTSPSTPSTPVTIPLQQMTSPSHMEYSNSSNFERDSLSNTASVKVPLLPPERSRTDTFNEQSTIPRDTGIPSTNKTTISHVNTSPTIWIRQGLTNMPLSSSSTNGPSNKRTGHTSKTSTQPPAVKLLYDRAATKNKESLYAIHIYNRLVFLMFLVIVIAINIYTWFFYSRTVRRKLRDADSVWSCFDESKLELVNCNSTT